MLLRESLKKNPKKNCITLYIQEFCTLFITISVQEGERGRFNRAPDRASGNYGKVRVEARLSTGRATRSAALILIRRS